MLTGKIMFINNSCNFDFQNFPLQFNQLENLIDDAGMEYLCYGVENSCLETLILNKNKINDDGLIRLSTSLCLMNTLKGLNLEGI